MEAVLSNVMKSHAQAQGKSNHTQPHNHNQTKPDTKTRRQKISEPVDSIDPAEGSKATLQKICDLLVWMRQEIKEIREELNTKVDLSNHNTLSLKVDALDDTVFELTSKMDD